MLMLNFTIYCTLHFRFHSQLYLMVIYSWKIQKHLHFCFIRYIVIISIRNNDHIFHTSRKYIDIYVIKIGTINRLQKQSRFQSQTTKQQRNPRKNERNNLHVHIPSAFLPLSRFHRKYIKETKWSISRLMYLF